MGFLEIFLWGLGVGATVFVAFFLYKNNKREDLYAIIKNLETENFALKTENQSHEYKVSSLEKEHSEKLAEKLEKLEFARLALESEKNRIMRIDEEERAEHEDKKYKQWAEHEKNVVFEIQNICKNPDFNFSVFDNAHLPFDFEYQIKPDCMIQFLDQYIVFDAKKSKNPKSYIANQVKTTAEKYAQSEIFEKIYSTIFFVLPESEIGELSQTVYSEKGYTFICISQSALYSVLFLLKKISQYAQLENFNPQERENLIQLIASYDTHISYQNAVNFVLAKQSFAIDETKKYLPKNFRDELNTVKNLMNDKKLNALEIQKYAKNADLQQKEISEYIAPQSKIDIHIMKESREVLNANI